jgi:hypothetical protein
MNIGKRIEIAKEFDSVLIHIKMSKNIFLLLFIPFCLLFWTLALISVFEDIQSAETQNGSVIVWLCGWLIGGVVISVIWLWNAFGREVVLISKNNFTYKRELFGVAITKKTVPIEKLSNLRAAGLFGTLIANNFRMEHLGFVGGAIALDEGWDTHRFGIWLEEKEAEALVEAIKPCFHGTSNQSLDAKRNQLLS